MVIFDIVFELVLILINYFNSLLSTCKVLSLGGLCSINNFL